VRVCVSMNVSVCVNMYKDVFKYRSYVVGRFYVSEPCIITFLYIGVMYKNVCMFVHESVYMYVHQYLCVCVSISVCVYVYPSMCVYVCP